MIEAGAVEVAIRLTVNGQAHHALVAPRQHLQGFLRGHLGLGDPQSSCETGDCSACMVLLDGKLVRACVTMTIDVQGAVITTMEGLSGDRAFAAVQRILSDQQISLCARCRAGVTFALFDLLRRVEPPTQAEIRAGLSAHPCCCGSHDATATAIGAIVRGLSEARRGE